MLCLFRVCKMRDFCNCCYFSEMFTCSSWRSCWYVKTYSYHQLEIDKNIGIFKFEISFQSLAVFAKSYQNYSEVTLICSFFVCIYVFDFFGTSNSFRLWKAFFHGKSILFFEVKQFCDFFLSRFSLDLVRNLFTFQQG